MNLTDGLDGLAAGTMIPPLAVFAAIAAQTMHLPGRCDRVLRSASAPAPASSSTTGIRRKIFMGDTGSLALGALLSGVAILTGEMLLLVLVGGVFVAEALSVIVQVAYFKATGGKRILRMSPLHHHFELERLARDEGDGTLLACVAALFAVGLAIVR